MLASTWFDLVIGVDLHFELVPPPMLPVPFPHPFVGLVFDPIGLAAGLAISNAIGMAFGDSFKGPVLINSMPANTTGTEAKNTFVLPHFIIPPGTMWAPMVRVPKPPIIPGKAPSLELPIPPPGDAVMITGSKTVHAMGANLCRFGDIALSCSDPIRLPTSVVLAIPKGLPVLVGGPPAVDWMAAAMGLIKCKWVAERLHKLVNRIKNARIRNLLHKGVCFLTGHPVDVATGRVLTEAKDFGLPGPLPLTFERNYASSWAHRDSPVGHGWSHSLDQAVWLEAGCVVYRAEDGREIEFDTFDMPGRVIRPGEEAFEPLNRLTLRSLGQYRWEIETADGVVHEFAPVPGDKDPKVARLLRKRTRSGHEITLHYDASAHLAWVRDVGGRIVRFEHDDVGRLAQVSLPHPTQPGWVPHTRYVYSREGDLVEVVDPLGHRTRYEYAGHLLVRETDRTGLSFYFGYDGMGSSAYCIRTWGDGGIYDHEIDYDKAGRVTYVTNSLGATTTYEMNVASAVVKVIDPLGGETRYEYDDNLWKTAEIDPLGNDTRYEYDKRGNRVNLSLPSGASARFEYDEHRNIIRAVDVCGGEWRWRYDQIGGLVQRMNPLGEVTSFEHSGGQLSAVINAAGARTSFFYDAAKNLCAVRGSLGAGDTYEHDRLGRVVTRKDARGAIQRRHYDPCGRLLTLEEPDGNVRRFAYDPSGNVTLVQDHQRRIRFHYSGFHKLAEREETGARVRLRYDTEGQLVGLQNEAGEEHSFLLDACGRIKEERDFDGHVRRYERDRAGRISKIVQPSGAWTSHAYDRAGRLTRALRSDGTQENFSYRQDGALVEAENATVTVRFERDALGRIVRESQGEHWIASRYEPGRGRVGFKSSLHADTTIVRNMMGDVESVSICDDVSTWRVGFGRDALGLEVERKLPGGVTTSWMRDHLGRPERRTMTRGAGEALATTSYRWEVNNRLSALIDSIRGATTFEHDARARLVSARYPDGYVQHRAPDATGNLYGHPDRTDRIYGRGGKLLHANGSEYKYDVDGNLIERTEPDGARWQFAWDGAGHLRGVTRPDGRRVTFAYDALGRRLRKRCENEEVTWIWDGHVPLHELSSTEEPITWIFEPTRLAPLGKLQGRVRYGIITDHVGAPAAMFDEAGTLAWQAQLDVYGVTRTDIAKTPCPWRWPGQYEDDETGLYYNRFRYYDPKIGKYISRDPIGLLGGLDVYGYTHDPLTWIDPFGLEGCEGFENVNRSDTNKIADELNDTTYFHYTDEAGLEGILEKGLIMPNSKSRVYLAQDMYNQEEAFMALFIGNPRYQGKGSHVLVINKPDLPVGIGHQPNELIHEGTLRLKPEDVVYAGPNPF
jgi:RHS repeat-associated protein